MIQNTPLQIALSRRVTLNKSTVLFMNLKEKKNAERLLRHDGDTSGFLLVGLAALRNRSNNGSRGRLPMHSLCLRPLEEAKASAPKCKWPTGILNDMHPKSVDPFNQYFVTNGGVDMAMESDESEVRNFISRGSTLHAVHAPIK